MDVRELAPGLWRWTALHPEWSPGADWEQEVGCLYLETPGSVVLIDPLVPGEPNLRTIFLDRLDADVERNGKPVSIMLTVWWHERSTGELAQRYDAEVWANAEGGRSRTETPVTHPFSSGDVLPGGLIGIDAQRVGETLYWLPEQRALISGDIFLGDGEGGVRICFQSWLGDVSHRELKLALAGLLELPVEMVLVAHGEPVLEDGLAALAAALAD